MAPPEGDLPRRFTLLDTTTLCIGGMIGSGIFLKPAAIATLLPSPPLIIAVWVAAGLLTLLGSLTYAELGARMPHHGGLYVILRDTFGRLPAFLFGWSLLAVMETGSIAGLAAGVAQLASREWPMDGSQQLLLAAGLIVFLTVLNTLSVKGGAWLQNGFTTAKTLGLVVLVMAGLGHTVVSHLSDRGTLPVGAALVSAFGACMVKALWAYDGWINVTFVAGEVQNPRRNLPWGLGIGTGIVIAVYVAANITYHTVLPLSSVQTSPSAGRDIALLVFGSGAAVGMSYLMMASAFGTMNSSVLTGARVYFAMARDGMLFRQLGTVLPGRQEPAASLALQGVWSIALLSMWQSFDRITDNVMFIYWIFYALGAFTVLRQRPHEATFRTIGYPVVPVLFIAVSIWLALNYAVSHPGDALQATILLVLGLILYPLVRSSAAIVPDAGSRSNTNSVEASSLHETDERC